MEQELQKLQQEAEDALQQITETAQLEAFRVKYLGRKGGLLTGVMRQLGTVAPADRPRLGSTTVSRPTPSTSTSVPARPDATN